MIQSIPLPCHILGFHLSSSLAPVMWAALLVLPPIVLADSKYFHGLLTYSLEVSAQTTSPERLSLTVQCNRPPSLSTPLPCFVLPPYSLT